jgi:acetyltransferase-like isoleucine patch superfamily enzyme
MIKGEDVIIYPSAVIKRPDLAIIGNHVCIDHFTYISVRLVVDDWVHIAPFVSIIGGVNSLCKIGVLSALSQGARIVCGSIDWVNSTGCSFATKRTEILGEVILEPLTGVCTNGIVLPNVTMAIGSILGANSLLDRDTVPWGVYIGTPARLIKYRNKEKILRDAKDMGYEF